LRVTVRFFTYLREITKKREEEIDLPSGSTLEELLRLLSKNYGQQFTDYVFNMSGEVQSRFHFLINGKSIHALDDFKTILVEGDKVAIVPPVGGG
jgi:molybdopterin synthase sulfur carrier subunit